MTRKTEVRILKKIVKGIGEKSDRQSCNSVTGFMAMVGKSYQRELMVVGRAVNGWTEKGWDPKQFRNDTICHKFISEILESVTEKPCPMKWVARCWGNKKEDYNSRRSAFWRVIRKVTNELRIADVESQDWPSHLVWTNLYKIAPEDGGNPPESLCSLQFEGCKQLLNEELCTYLPKRVLFLTGLGWAEPFIEDFTPRIVTASKCKYVEAISEAKFLNYQSRIVVAAHPQGKPECDFVQEVINAFTAR